MKHKCRYIHSLEIPGGSFSLPHFYTPLPLSLNRLDIESPPLRYHPDTLPPFPLRSSRFITIKSPGLKGAKTRSRAPEFAVSARPLNSRDPSQSCQQMFPGLKWGETRNSKTETPTNASTGDPSAVHPRRLMVQG